MFGSVGFGKAVSDTAAVTTAFAAGDKIDLKGLSYVSGMSSLSYSATTGVLQVTEGSKVADLYFGAGNTLVDDPFHLTPGATGGTLVTNDAPACYCLATLILTVRGEVPVEALAIGDRVITASGGSEAIKWIGRRSYAGRFLAANPGVQPIRFQAGSLGGRLPRRDLLVSPEHAMFLDGLLVPACHLANGNTITRERGLERVDYYHVELDGHDVILAEGAASESFADDDSRGAFHNAHEFAALYPDAPSAKRFCAPRVEQGSAREAIRRRLAVVATEAARAAA